MPTASQSADDEARATRALPIRDVMISAADGGLGTVYARLIRSLGEAEADAILEAAKQQVPSGAVEEWLLAAIGIVDERHPGALDPK